MVPTLAGVFRHFSFGLIAYEFYSVPLGGVFWSIAPAIYLLLRQSVDATELDEIVLDEPVGG